MTETVLLVGNDDIFREGLKSLLVKNGFTLSGEYDGITEMLQTPEAKPPASLIIHIADKRSLSAEKVTSLKKAFAHSRVVVVSGRTEMPEILPVFSAGVDGYILKDISCSAFLGSLRLVVAGEKVYPTTMLELLGRQTGRPAANDSRGDMLPNGQHLSRQEMRIVHCLANGDPNKVIAQRLNISETTVKVHVRTILRKMGARNRTQAALMATSHGLVEKMAGHQLQMNV